MPKEEVLKAWQDEVCKKDIDPENRYCWESLFVGFALGKGLSVKEATDYSFYINEAFPLESTDQNTQSGALQGPGKE